MENIRLNKNGEIGSIFDLSDIDQFYVIHTDECHAEMYWWCMETSIDYGWAPAARNNVWFIPKDQSALFTLRFGHLFIKKGNEL